MALLPCYSQRGTGNGVLTGIVWNAGGGVEQLVNAMPTVRAHD